MLDYVRSHWGGDHMRFWILVSAILAGSLAHGEESFDQVFAEDKVVTERGCIVSHETLGAVLKDIERDRYREVKASKFGS